ncbi:HET-domain-containing protein [Phaeosphaeriaceae sp. SRC1lsM3a]|nr:HET-domain-containing protein [Stagonospora sp. SRC1lsM3a]
MRLDQRYYEALSYEWGDPNGLKHTILINGQPIQVRDNLFHALACLRELSMFEPLWIDALCINQNDIRERNHQVGMMALIYKSAAKVRVWLGQEDASIIQAFGLLARIGALFPGWRREFVEAHYKYYEKNREVASRYPELIWERGVDVSFSQLMLARRMLPLLKSISKEEWGSLLLLVNRSYWTRLWIVQEFVLARNVVICSGKAFVNSEDLELTIQGMHILKFEDPSRPLWQEQSPVWDIFRGICTKIVEMRILREVSPLVELLESTMESKCQDPHDRIYAIIAIAKDLSSFYDTIPIDYNRSIFKVKMDLVWAVQTRSRFKKDYISRLCSLLDEIFAEYPDDE